MSQKTTATSPQAAFTSAREGTSERARRDGPCGVVSPEQSFLGVQQAIGQCAVRSLLRGGLLQPKLRIGAPDDFFEREADRMADTVMRMAEPDRGTSLAETGRSADRQIQRMCEECAEEEEGLRRQPLEGEEELLQPKVAPGASATQPGVGVESRIASLRGGGRPLAPSLRSFFEPRFGYDFGDVRVHTGSAAAEASRSIQSRAFTLGRDIVFGAGEYTPESSQGRRLLAHELTHVVQQTPLTARRKPVWAQRKPLPGARPLPRLSTLSRRIQRLKVTSKSKASKNQARIDATDGQKTRKFRVTRVVTVTPKTISSWKYKPPKFQAGADWENVWLELKWCTGLQGKVTFGANVPAALKSVVGSLANSAMSGKDPASAIGGTTVTSFINFTLAQSGGYVFQLDINGSVDLQGRFQSAGGTATLSKGPFAVFIKGQGVPPQPGQLQPGWVIIGGLQYKLGKKSPTFTCPVNRQRTTVLQSKSTYTCEELIHTPEKTVTTTKQVPSEDVKSYFIYFKYAQDKLNAKDPFKAKNDAAKMKIQSDLGSGYQVKKIEGFTSPEGPLGATKKFRGNIQLALDRANSAKELVKSLCPQSVASCFHSSLTVSGKDELYSPPPDEKTGEEKKGKDLAAHAVEKFMQEKAESRHRTEELTKKIERRKGSPRQQAKLVYPLLRRAEVTLVKPVMKTVTSSQVVPASSAWQNVVPCLPEILAAAKSIFKSTRIHP